ncbi:MAG: gamma-glutamyl-gamma-aminobutyrate hydrolase family protein [Bdellovibrionota bacterium]|nr:gamma-glutamyl-gamma-aminobutyrate hydrolase family protein [Bdellovibrionota bacterium]
MIKPVAIVDPAISHPSYNCMNKIVERHQIPVTYHWVSSEGVESLSFIEEPSAYIVFGSDSNVGDNLDWQIKLSALMKEKIEKGIPVLGICFGHQLIADAYGSKIDLVVPENKCFEGVREVEILEERFGFKKGEKVPVFITHHYEVKELPENFIHLGTSKDCHLDAIAHKHLPFFSFQGHPEASDKFLNDHLEVELSDEDIKRGKEGGALVIENFLKYAGVIK